MQAGADLLSGIFNVTFTVQKLQAMNKTLLQYITQQKPARQNSKPDPFLESMRPLFKGIYTKVKKKLDRVMHLRMIGHLNEISRKNTSQDKNYDQSDRSEEEEDDELQNAVLAMERYKDIDLQRYTKMTQKIMEDITEEPERQQFMQNDPNSRSKIPLLHK